MTDQGALRARRSSSRRAVEARRSGIPGEAEFIGRGVSWCATCDGPLYRGRTVAVVGGGDSAVEEGLFLTKFADKVYLVHRRDELRAAPIAQERCFASPKFEFVWDSVPRRIDGDQAVEALEVENVKTKEVRRLPVNGVFMYIGQLPNTGLARRGSSISTSGLHRHRRVTCRPELPGVFACGDAHVNPIKQIAMAVGEGALAAVQAERYLDALACALPGAASAAGGSAAAPGLTTDSRGGHTWTQSHRTTSKPRSSRPPARSSWTSGPSGAARAA